MQPAGDEQTQHDSSPVSTLTAPADSTVHAVQSLVPGESDRAREEMSVLLVGFATGLSIGVVFLIYIVLDIAHLLN